jgi:hypothetical protein
MNQNKTLSYIGGELYSDVNVISTTIFLILGLTISIFMIGIGLYLLITNGDYTETQAVVNNSSCTQKFSKEFGREQDCTSVVKYNVNFTNYTGKIPTGSVEKENNTVVKILYNTKNPNIIQQKNNLRKTIAIIFLVIALLIIAAIVVQYLLR